jgi:hypothetical protein
MLRTGACLLRVLTRDAETELPSDNERELHLNRAERMRVVKVHHELAD